MDVNDEFEGCADGKGKPLVAYVNWEEVDPFPNGAVTPPGFNSHGVAFETGGAGTGVTEGGRGGGDLTATWGTSKGEDGGLG